MHSATPLSTRLLQLRFVRFGQRHPQSGVFALTLVCSAVCMAMLGMMLAGCGNSSNSVTKAGSISIVSPSGAAGQLTSLSVNATAKLSMTPMSDTLKAGVDWTVTCGGNPITGSVENGACGTLGPTHTADGAVTTYTAPPLTPLGASITITATVTSNPSQSSTASLTIISLPIAVSFGSAPPSSLDVNGSQGFQVNVTNDPTKAGVFWTATCPSSACGTFSQTVTAGTGPATTYFAPSAVPSGGTVTITATSVADTTKSASVKLAITTPTQPPPPPQITVSVSPATIYVPTTTANRKVSFTATVNNDASGAGVDWKVNCSNCGSITTHTDSGAAANFVGPASVPPGQTVTITATSTADPTASATAVATIVTALPIIVAMSPTSSLPTTLTTGSQATLAATVTSDNNNLGVNWTATCGSAGACGSFNLVPPHTASGGQIIYTAPSAIPTGSVVTITASSPASTPSDPAFSTTTIVAQPPSLAFQQSPPAALTSATAAPVSATVTNDVAPAGVTWSVQCGSTVAGGCGWIAPIHTASGATATYTAPPVTSRGTSVTIAAASTADPKVSITAPVTINPSTTLSVDFIPSAPSQVPVGATVNLAAMVANDGTNAGVDLQVCASGCGFFTVKPEIPATTVPPYLPEVPAVTATSVSAWSNGLPIPYTAPLQAPSSGSVVVVAAAHANPTAANSATLAITSNSDGPALHGAVRAGTQPVRGASVTLNAAGASGYGSLASQISAPGQPSAAVTDSNGNFTVPGGYSCPHPNSQMYLVATGGQVGTNAANPNLVLMTALGSCNTLSSSHIVLNEVTSVASAFATAPFASNHALTGNSSYLYLGASGGNSSGLANAFAAVNNLVDISTGQARFTVPAGNAAVPYVEINTLADILNACTATAGGVEGDGSVCDTLFTATDVLPQHSLYNSVAPADTLQAIYNIAQHPAASDYGYQLGNLFALATADSPFQPVLTENPEDWSISLHYTTGGGLTAASKVGSFAVDASGNLWITDTTAGSVIEWNSLGAALSPSIGFPAGGGPMAIDAAGNVWISGDGVLTELTDLGSPLPGSPFGGVAGGGTDMAIDAQGGLWIATSTGVAEFNSLGAEISPTGGYISSGLGKDVTAVGIDSLNNVWMSADTLNETPIPSGLAELTNPGGQLIADARPVASPGAPPEFAADAAGNMWYVIAGGGLCEVRQFDGIGANIGGDCGTYAGGGRGPNDTDLWYANARGVALDGAGTVWLASQGGTAGQNILVPNITPVIPSLPAASASVFFMSESLAAGTLRVAVDGSGNVWVLLADNTVTEYVGIATPVVTPIALGVKNKKLGAKP